MKVLAVCVIAVVALAAPAAALPTAPIRPLPIFLTPPARVASGTSRQSGPSSLASRALTALRNSSPSYPALRVQLADQVARYERTATAAQLDDAWAATSSTRLTVVFTALSAIGRGYQFASAGPTTFDCSGLTAYAWASVGVTLPRQSEAQIAQIAAVAPDRVQPGDIVHWPNHVGIALGAGSTLMHAVGPGQPAQPADIGSSSATFGSPLG